MLLDNDNFFLLKDNFSMTTFPNYQTPIKNNLFYSTRKITMKEDHIRDKFGHFSKHYSHLCRL